MTVKKRIVIGITGASGIVYAQQLIKAIEHTTDVTVIITHTARKVAAYEQISLDDFNVIYLDNTDIDNQIASGSFQYDAMIVVPCSMKTLSAIANGYAESLLTRCADVALKERRPLILVPRESPYNRIHLTNMLAANDAGALILPASPPLYSHPKTITDLADMTVARILDHCRIPHTLGTRWNGEDSQHD